MTKLDPLKANEFATSRKPGSESLVEESDEYHDLGHDFGMETMRDTELDSIFESRRRLLSESHLPSPSLSDSMELESVDDSPFEEVEKDSFNRLEFVHDAFHLVLVDFLRTRSRLNWEVTTTRFTSHRKVDGRMRRLKQIIHSMMLLQIPLWLKLIKVLSVFLPGRFSATLI